MQNDYLQTLNLSPGATEKEVKSAYRKLSKRYHPDVSKDPEAKDKFIAINEAYNFLTSVGPSPRAEHVTYDYDPYAAAYDRQRKEARKRAWQRAKEVERMQQALMKKILNGFMYLGAAIVLFNFTLALDYLLPRNVVDEQVLESRSVIERSRGKSYYRYDELQFENYFMRFDRHTVKDLDLTGEATVELTMLWQKPLEVTLSTATTPVRLQQLYNVYHVFGYIIPLMFLIVYLYQFQMRTLDSKMTLAIFMLFLFGIQFVVFLRF